MVPCGARYTLIRTHYLVKIIFAFWPSYNKYEIPEIHFELSHIFRIVILKANGVPIQHLATRKTL